MFERLIIAAGSYLLALYMILRSTHQLIVTNILDYETWILSGLQTPVISNAFMSSGILIGVVTGVSRLFGMRRTHTLSLAIITAYQIALALLNIIDHNFKGSPWIPALFVASFSALLWSYQKVLYESNVKGKYANKDCTKYDKPSM